MRTMQVSLFTLLVILQVYSVSSSWEAFENAVFKVSRDPKFSEERLKQTQDARKESWLSWLLGGKSSKWSCPASASTSKPTSVHKLLPGDIQVVGALGDSLTAGNGAGADTIVGVLLQFRGLSWSVGGSGSLDEGIVTIPNILKKYNPNLKGYSIGLGFSDSKNAKLNRAEAGATAVDMLGQAKSLVSSMRKMWDVNMYRDWKLVTVFVGGNDLCDYCTDKQKYGPDGYVNNIKAALDYLQKNLRRTFVNLVSLFDITPVADIANGPICNLVQQGLCNCALSESNKPQIKQVGQGYNTKMEQLIASGRYDTRDDFTVVFQPFFKDATLPKIMKDGKEQYDTSYFAPDCFHFGEKGHQAAAIALWNEMFVPMKSKSNKWDHGETLKCPASGAYLATAKNSKA